MVRESGQKPELTRSGRDAELANSPLSQGLGKADRSKASEPEDLSILAGPHPADPTTRPRERVDGDKET
jgi:hypothetical protein